MLTAASPGVYYIKHVLFKEQKRKSFLFSSSFISFFWMVQKGSKTILHRGFTESIKNILKTIKLTENADIRKVIPIHLRGK